MNTKFLLIAALISVVVADKFAIVFQGAGKRTIWREESTWRIPMRAVYLNTSDQHIGNTWSPDNPGAFFPALTNQSELNNYNYQCSSWSVEDGAYLRLKNVTLGYSLPASLLAKTKILSKARVYVTGSDLWEHSKINDGWDPEANRKVDNSKRYPAHCNFWIEFNLLIEDKNEKIYN